MLWKKRSHTRSGLVNFFRNVYAQMITRDAVLLLPF